eukprot:scaffold5260_cov84-Skeletonema_marinoi.AAC.3
MSSKVDALDEMQSDWVSILFMHVHRPNRQFKDAFERYCTEEEEALLDKWFPTEEEKKEEAEDDNFNKQMHKQMLDSLEYSEEMMDSLMSGLQKLTKYQRKRCRHRNCKNQAQTGGVCIKHGSKVVKRKSKKRKQRDEQSKEDQPKTKAPRKKPQCSAEGCTKYPQRGGLCIAHGGKKKQCSSEGCTTQVRSGGLCIKHGAKKVSKCIKDDCLERSWCACV